MIDKLKTGLRVRLIDRMRRDEYAWLNENVDNEEHVHYIPKDALGKVFVIDYVAHEDTLCVLHSVDTPGLSIGCIARNQIELVDAALAQDTVTMTLTLDEAKGLQCLLYCFVACDLLEALHITQLGQQLQQLFKTHPEDHGIAKREAAQMWPKESKL